MFSANENLALRQHKKKLVDLVESTIPENALDMGTMVMAMQVSCKAPGCVPLETAIVIVFPKVGKELIPGLSESKGGNYKTKVLKPMAEVTKDDILDALPPEFQGGRRSVEKLCIQARDVMLGQITQLFADEDKEGRVLMAKYLQQCLGEYIQRDCTPPEWGEPWVDSSEVGGVHGGNTVGENSGDDAEIISDKTVAVPASSSTSVAKTGNFIFKRPAETKEEHKETLTGTDITSHSHSSNQDRNQILSHSNSKNNNTTHASTATHFSASSSPFSSAFTKPPEYQASTATSSQSIMAQLNERQHTPGIRRPGCPCCDPDSADNMIDKMMAL